ncbi:MAG: hypothetical protein H7Z43_09845 [Clostridia bacterium]|nr:hypothetical protein [Deltaproteobacteria bacterium]
MQARLTLALAVAALVGCLLLDLVYVFRSQRDLVRERRHEQAYVVTTAAAQLPAQVEAYVAHLAAEHAMIVTLVGTNGHVVQSQAKPDFSAFIYAKAPLIYEGHEHLAASTTSTKWPYVIVSRPLKETSETILAEQPRIILLLSCVAAVITGIALLFMRNNVMRPLERLQERTTQDRKDLEAQLKDLAKARRELEETRDQLVRAERLAAVGRLAAGLAHEVGNPLAVLTGYVSILRDTTLPEIARNDAVQRMERELNRIQGTVRGLLDYARAPSGAIGEAAVRDVIEHVTKLIEPNARKKSIRITTAIEDTRVRMSGDALTQVLLNLTLNALDATPENGRLAVSSTGGDSTTIIDVEDSGPGFTADVAARLFEPFFTTKPAGVGTGLGLSVCESLITAANGSIAAEESQTLGGARFRLTLPSP